MRPKVEWSWTYSSILGQIHGTVQAVDPRDALSRALTSTTASGRLFGEEHRIPVSVLNEAPSNFDNHYALAGDGFAMWVQKVAEPELEMA